LSVVAERRRASSGSPFEASIGFSRAVRVGNRILVSGTAPIEADGSSTVGDAGVQTTRCLDVIIAAVEQLGGTVNDIVRTRVFLLDAAEAGLIGAAHGAVFGEIRPASSMIVVAGLLRPEWRLEIEAEALVGHEEA